MGRNKIYDWTTEEEKRECRKKYDKEQKQLKYWLKNYNIKLKPEQVEMFLENKAIIKKALPLMDFMKTLEIV